MSIFDSTTRFEFEDQTIFNYDVTDEFANNYAFVSDLQRMLLLAFNGLKTQFNNQSILIHLFQKTNTQRVRYPHRTTDNTLSQLIHILEFIHQNLFSSVSHPCSLCSSVAKIKD